MVYYINQQVLRKLHKASYHEVFISSAYKDRRTLEIYLGEQNRPYTRLWQVVMDNSSSAIQRAFL